MIDFDKVLRRIGEFGRYQKIRFYLLLFCVGILYPYTSYNLIFMSYTPPYQYSCDNGTVLPVKECPQKADLQVCTNITFNNTDYTETLVTRWNLVCDRSYIADLLQTISNVGYALGCVLLAYIQDKYGRKIGFFVTVGICAVPGVIALFCPEPISYLFVRLLNTMGVIAGWSSPYILALEMVGPSKRTLVTAVMIVVFAAGSASVGLIAWLCTDWFQLGLATTVPFFVFFALWPFIDESPRWLFTTRRFAELRQLCDKIATVNGCPLRKGEVHFLIAEREMRASNDATMSAEHSDPNVLDLFRTNTIRLKTFILIFEFAVNATVYIGIAFNVDNLGGNRFLNFSILMLMEFPAGLFVLFSLNRFGRIWPMSLSMLSGGVAATVTSLVPNSPIVVGLLASVAKFGISSSFAILCQIAGELFPTPLRGTGTGVCALVGGLATITVPYIIKASGTLRALPMIIMGIMCLLGGFLVLFLPETLNQVMPETIADCDYSLVGLQTFKRNVTLRGISDARALPQSRKETMLMEMQRQSALKLRASMDAGDNHINREEESTPMLDTNSHNNSQR